MNESESSAMVEAAARTNINERCAAAFLHDLRGSMQALFSAFELLGRSARMGGGNPLRVEKACELAKRAITHHEKSTMQIVELLTLQHPQVVTVDLGSLVREAAHFLRNDGAARGVTLKVTATPGQTVHVARARLQTMLVGLLTAAIDHAQPGCELPVDVHRAADEAVVIVSSAVGSDTPHTVEIEASTQLRPIDLTFLFARHVMASTGGRLEVGAAQGAHASMRLYFPVT